MSIDELELEVSSTLKTSEALRCIEQDEEMKLFFKKIAYIFPKTLH